MQNWSKTFCFECLKPEILIQQTQLHAVRREVHEKFRWKSLWECLSFPSHWAPLHQFCFLSRLILSHEEAETIKFLVENKKIMKGSCRTNERSEFANKSVKKMPMRRVPEMVEWNSSQLTSKAMQIIDFLLDSSGSKIIQIKHSIGGRSEAKTN